MTYTRDQLEAALKAERDRCAEECLLHIYTAWPAGSMNARNYWLAVVSSAIRALPPAALPTPVASLFTAEEIRALRDGTPAPVARPFCDLWQHGETGRMLELPMGVEAPHGYAKVSTPVAPPAPVAPASGEAVAWKVTVERAGSSWQAWLHIGVQHFRIGDVRHDFAEAEWMATQLRSAMRLSHPASTAASGEVERRKVGK